jgi:hypothetical protein
MSATFTINVNQKEAFQLISGVVPKSLNKKIVTSIQTTNCTPKGAKAAVIARAKKTATAKTVESALTA